MNARHWVKKAALAAVVAAMISAAAGQVGAAPIDLTGGGTATFGDSIFTTTDNQSTGTGVIQSFVRISTNDGIVEGYNTDARPLQFDENNSPIFTRSLLLSAVPIVTIDGVEYREFLLDINQQDRDSFLTLNELQIFVGNTGSPIGATVGAGGTLSFGGQATLIYDMDDEAVGGVDIDLDYGLNSGSGSGDLFVYVRSSLFTGGTHVTLYSSFGDPNANNDGFEEWAIRSVTTPDGNPVPEPSSIALAVVGLLGFGAAYRRRKQQQNV